jgi:hypothetical protein
MKSLYIPFAFIFFSLSGCEDKDGQFKEIVSFADDCHKKGGHEMHISKSSFDSEKDLIAMRCVPLKDKS